MATAKGVTHIYLDIRIEETQGSMRVTHVTKLNICPSRLMHASKTRIPSDFNGVDQVRSWPILRDANNPAYQLDLKEWR